MPLSAVFFCMGIAADLLYGPMLKLKWIMLEESLRTFHAYWDAADFIVSAFNQMIAFRQPSLN